VHLLALVAISVFVVIVSYILYLIADRLIPMRVERQAELIGLDLSQHNESHL
jgi:Amt family ammonium transporter